MTTAEQIESSPFPEVRQWKMSADKVEITTKALQLIAKQRALRAKTSQPATAN